MSVIASSTFSYRLRWLLVVLSLFLLFSLLLVQFSLLQICEGEFWAKKATQQHFFTNKELAPRGTFYGRPYLPSAVHPFNTQQIVMDIEKYHLHADPQSLPPQYRQPLIDHLRLLLQWEERDSARNDEQLQKKSRDRTLAKWLNKEQRDAIQSWWLPYAKEHKIPRNALFFVIDQQRSYPYGSILGQVLHTVQNVRNGRDNLAKPTGGIEWVFDTSLRGREGKKQYRRSPRNSFETGEDLIPPVPGGDIHTTIDLGIQAIAEEELERGVKKANARCGWAVVMDPRTGDVLALAQYPSFYPSDYPQYFNDSEKIENTKVRATTDALEPGSIMKPITIAIALQANRELIRQGKPPLFDPEEKIATADGKFPGRSKPLRDITRTSFLNMDMAMQKSSNIYVARLVERIIERLGREWYRDQLQNVFGFGSKTGIELPSETAGVLPTPGKKHPNGRPEWSVPTPFSLAMGYNIQVNTLQMLRAFAVFVNGGYLIRPTLLDHVEEWTENGEKILWYGHASPPQHVLDPEIGKRVVQAMKYVMKTGEHRRRGAIGGYTTFGKSGSEEKLVNGHYNPRLHHSFFIGAPIVKDPPFLVAITLDEPEYGILPRIGRIHLGGYCAAPIFRQISYRSLVYLGIPPDDPYGYPKEDPRHDPNKADWVQEVATLQEKYELWNNS